MRTPNDRTSCNGSTALGWEDKAWVDQELDGALFQDVRLGKRLRTLLGLMSNGLGQTIPLACQDWANTKAAYRFFSNSRINEAEILSGHFASSPEKQDDLSTYLIRIARLGGYLARATDAPPGNTTMWRGLGRLTDIQLGFLLAKGDVGN